MKIGILIPTFNRKVYLEEALKSVREQTYDNIELIVIDNGSTDGTAEFMAGITDTRVRYVVNERNIGLIGSINKGINLFSGKVEWCSILSDDDFLHKDFIKILLQVVFDSSAKSIVHSHRIFVDEHGHRIKEAVLSPKEETAFDYIKMRACFKRQTYLSGVLFNRTAFQEINGYPSFSTGLASDDAFIFALSLKDRLLYDRNAIAYIRIHEEAESQSSSDGLRKLQTIQQFGEYCNRVAMESGTFDRIQCRKFEGAVKKYLRALFSDVWIKTAQFESTHKNANNERLSELLSLVKINRDNFTFRVKFAVDCWKFTGIFPEKYASYRAFWGKIIKICLSIK